MVNSGILIFQQTVGVSLFSLQKALQMVGLYWGLFLTFLGCYLTTYGLLLLSNTAGEIEDRENMDKRIKNLDELADHIDYPGIQIVKWLMMISGLGIMIASSVTNIFIVSSIFADLSKFLRRSIPC
jgi:amino acid permease